jgi:hypothetical protein
VLQENDSPRAGAERAEELAHSTQMERFSAISGSRALTPTPRRLDRNYEILERLRNGKPGNNRAFSFLAKPPAQLLVACDW